MVKQGFYKILKNDLIAKQVYCMVLQGDTSSIQRPGQFINIKINDSLTPYLRRPISICDYDEATITIIYKVIGIGTKLLANKLVHEILDCLVGLGNGYDVDLIQGEKIVLVGGGVGVPPLFRLAKELKQQGKKFSVVLGFQAKEDVFYEQEFLKMTKQVAITTVKGDYGIKGFVTNVMNASNCDYYAACGPEAMLQALIKTKINGQLSFEERMGCGFGACMGCSCKTLTGYKRICVEGPVMKSSEVMIYE